MIRRLLRPAAVAAVLLMALAPTQTAPVAGQARTPGVVAIRNATLVTVTKGTIQNGTIVLRDGKIAGWKEFHDQKKADEALGS